eukprot:Colp12_sorted_trinity150504_noHs@3355
MCCNVMSELANEDFTNLQTHLRHALAKGTVSSEHALNLIAFCERELTTVEKLQGYVEVVGLVKEVSKVVSQNPSQKVLATSYRAIIKGWKGLLKTASFQPQSDTAVTNTSPPKHSEAKTSPEREVDVKSDTIPVVNLDTKAVEKQSKELDATVSKRKAQDNREEKNAKKLKTAAAVPEIRKLKPLERDRSEEIATIGRPSFLRAKDDSGPDPVFAAAPCSLERR